MSAAGARHPEAGDAAALRPWEEETLLDLLREHDWRDALEIAFARVRPALVRTVTDPRAAAPLSLLDVERGCRCLVVGDDWGGLAVPLARHAGVVALAGSRRRASLLRRIAEEEGAPLGVVAGDLGALPFRDEAFDVVFACDAGGVTLACLRAARARLRRHGRLYVAAANPSAMGVSGAPEDDAGGELAEYRQAFALAGLAEEAAYACFPHHRAPRHVIAMENVDAFIGRSWAALARALGWDAGAPGMSEYRRLARAGAAAARVPSFAFVLRKTD